MVNIIECRECYANKSQTERYKVIVQDLYRTIDRQLKENIFLKNRNDSLAKSRIVTDANTSKDLIDALNAKILELNAHIAKTGQEINRNNALVHQRNKELDALHYVWCSGGCSGGTHRFTDKTITEEIVQEAERNTKRLRNWYDSFTARQKRLEQK